MLRMKSLKAMAQIFVIFIFASILVLFVSSKLIEINSLEGQAAAIREDIAKEKAIQDQLLHDIESTKSDAFIESIARKQLGLVKYDEIIYIIEE